LASGARLYRHRCPIPPAVQNRATELGEISRSLQTLAKEMHCPVLALSQLNRSVEIRNAKRPLMSELAQIRRHRAGRRRHHVICRDDYYSKEAGKEPGVAEMIIAKQRNGPVGTVKLAFLKPLARFENLATEDQCC
jgi:replicative DNA helicase